MIQKYKEKLSDAGLDISPTIAPTGEMSGKLKYIYIGNDIRPSAREDVGASSNRIFTLRSNPAVTYTGQVPQSGEDGADITAAHVTLCPAEETPDTDVPETDVPETETPETDTPETETPETETPNTDIPETDVPETETPNTDTPETETPVEEAPESETPQRTLATTGASVIGITVGALVLLAGGIFLARRKKQ